MSDGHSERLEAALEGKYRIGPQLGEGGMARVYLAEDLRHGRRVALKVLRPERAIALEAERFLAEIRTTASLRHPNVLPLFDSGEVDGCLYYVMPYVEGETLRQKLDREKQLGVEEAVAIVREVAGALDYAHRRGVVHRDIKPSNIMLEGERVLLSDFGIALASDHAADGRLTESGTSVGTPAYMSPEQAAGSSDVDHRADVYSLACVLHEMLAGEPLFTGKTSRAVLAKHLSIAPPPVRALRPGVPRSVEAALLKALQKSPADRFDSVGAFADALVTGAREGVAAALNGWGARATRPALVAGAAVIATVAVLAIAFVRRAGVPAWEGRPESLVVLPFYDPATPSDDQAPLREVTEFIARELDRWNDVRAVRAVDAVGPSLDLGLRPGALERIDDGLAVARRVGVQAMLAVTLRTLRGSRVAEAQLYDVRTGVSTGPPMLSDGAPDADLETLAPIISATLGLPSADDPMRALRAGTADPGAALAYLEALGELHGARLEAAEDRFRAALAVDPTFASAMTGLAQTLFWQATESLDQMSSALGPEITRLSTAATDYLGGLSARHRLYVTAFYAFQLGAYDQARQLYQELQDLDPTDPFTLMMIGEVELQDPWLRAVQGEARRPRSDANKALESLLETVRLAPTFELAYGRLLGIQGRLDRALASGTCTVFDDARGRSLPPWQAISPSSAATSFCLGATDSLVWLSREQYEATDELELRDGADRMLARFVTALERWASVSPEQPRAYEQLSDARLLRRRRAGIASPELLSRLGQEALEFYGRAVALRPDTTAQQLVRLSNLHLAAGQLGQAILLSERALARYRGPDGEDASAAPAQLGNALVAGGRTSAALAVVSEIDQSRFVRSPVTGDLISYAGAEPIIQRVRVLGAVGVGGTALLSELESLEGVWRVAGYSDAETQVLRERLRGSLAPSLLADTAAMDHWRQMDTGSVDPVWEALTSIHHAPERASEGYSRLVTGGSFGLRESTRAFVLGLLAGALGRHEPAIRHYSRLDSIPYDVDLFDPGWGLRVSSLPLRARHYVELGDTVEALRHLESFVELRESADSLAEPSVRSAEREVLRIRSELSASR